MNSVTRYKKNLTLDWNRILSFVRTAERNIKSIWTTRDCLGPPCYFHQAEVPHFNRPKNSNNSLIRDQNSNKHIANGYKKASSRLLKRGCTIFSGKKRCRKSLTAGSPSRGSNVNCKCDRKAVVTWQFAVCRFPMINLCLCEVSETNVMSSFDLLAIFYCQV